MILCWFLLAANVALLWSNYRLHARIERLEWNNYHEEDC
jgi:hypothetical protein